MEAKLKVHEMKAQRFYKHLQEKENGVVMFSLDCENQIIPKVSDQ